MSSKPELKLDWCTHEAAKYAVMNWHYSKSMPVAKAVTIGVWEQAAFVGAVVFSWGANPNIGKPYSLEMIQVAELVRVALRKHENPVSKILAQSFRMIRRQSPGLRLLVSYADTEQGHHGGIYQAGGWVYTGTTAVKHDYVDHGKKLQRRAYTGKNFGKLRLALPQTAVKVVSPVKHRYLMPLDDAMREQIEPLRKTYPKRVTSADSGTSAIHAEGGGAIPTVTLLQNAD